LAPGVLLYNFAIILGHYFSGIGKYHINTIASSIGLVVSVVLFISLIPAYAIKGAGIATSISYGVTSLVLLIIFVRESKISAIEFIPGKKDLAMIKELLSFRKKAS
jgi:O-antigen/teichoic acid export membrane protein